MKKILTLTICSLLNLYVSTSEAATFTSKLVPMSGQYNINYSYMCIADPTAITSTNYPSFYTKEQEGVGQFTFTADNKPRTGVTVTDALIAWVASLGATYGNPVSPKTFLTRTNEIPIQWGIVTGKNSQAEYTTPTTTNPIPIIYKNGGIGPVFITSFNYPDNSVGNAIYLYDSLYKQWKVEFIYFNTPLTSISSNITSIGTSVDFFTSNTFTFPYNCRTKLTLFK